MVVDFIYLINLKVLAHECRQQKSASQGHGFSSLLHGLILVLLLTWTVSLH
jgi:hypothetical protein